MRRAGGNGNAGAASQLRMLRHGPSSEARADADLFFRMHVLQIAHTDAMLIRALSSDDAAAFQSLRLRGLLEYPEAFSSSHAEEAGIPIQLVAERLQPDPNGAVFGCFGDAQLTGVIGIRRAGQLKLSHKAFIWGMYVAPEHRRVGTGRLLLSRVLNYAAADLRVRNLNLGVNASNVAACTLYAAMGFRIYGTEPGSMMVDGILHDEHLMTRQVVLDDIV